MIAEEWSNYRNTRTGLQRLSLRSEIRLAADSDEITRVTFPKSCMSSEIFRIMKCV